MKADGTGDFHARRLKKLLTEADLESCRVDEWTRGVTFPGRDREWVIEATLTPDWVHLSTAFCDVPKEAGLRGRLYEHAMQENRRMNLAKFGTVAKSLVLELDYSAEHVDARVLANLIGFAASIAQAQYPAVCRIVSGDEALEVLEASMRVR